MTPVSLNPAAHSLPLVDHQKEDENYHLFYSPTHQDPTNSSSSPASCRVFDDSYTGDIRKQRHDQEPAMDDWRSVSGPKNKEDKEEMSRSSSHKSSAKWKCSEVKVMQKIEWSSSPDNSSSNTASHKVSNYSPTWRMGNITNSNRVCADCSTTSTPLWRSGPNGPKSLCNACGIRQRKARKAMEEAGNGVGGWCGKARIGHNKEKKFQLKNKWKGSITGTSQSQSEGKRRAGFKDFDLSLEKRHSVFQQRVFPLDEVVEGALLLMDLSCGFFPFN